MKCKRGDIVLVVFPNSDLVTAKPRPALVTQDAGTLPQAIIVQSDDLSTELPQVIIAMITTKLSRAGHPSRVLILMSSEEGKKTGLRTDSVVMTDNLATILERTIYKIIGRLEDMSAVDAALQHTLGFK